MKMEYSDYLEPRYRLRAAAEAAAFPLNTLRSNYQRGWFQSFGNGLSAGRGRAQRLCLGDILVLAIASRLIDAGVAPMEAYNAAVSFGVVAKTPKGVWRRMPFELFDRDQFHTILVWRRGSAANVVPVRKGQGLTLDELGVWDAFGEVSMVLPLNAVEATVFAQLGLSDSEPPGGS